MIPTSKNVQKVLLNAGMEVSVRDNIDPINLEIGMRIKEIRTRKGWSQKTLAMKAGITIQSVLYIEKGKRGLSSHTIRSISRALEVTADHILFGRAGYIGNSGIGYFIATGLSDAELEKSLEVLDKVTDIFQRYKEARQDPGYGAGQDEDESVELPESSPDADSSAEMVTSGSPL